MKDDELTVLEDNGEWSKISCSFGTGYIKSQYITKEQDDIERIIMPNVQSERVYYIFDVNLDFWYWYEGV